MDWILSLLLATVRLAIPVLLISLAELYGQRAGMVNIGLEGLASIGALVGFLVCYVTGSNWLGLLCGALAFGYTFFLVTPLYKATAMMYVNNSAISVGSTKVSMVYLNMVQEAQNVVSFTANLLKVSRKFQKE